jgi:Na+-driven multidrug efflux pump
MALIPFLAWIGLGADGLSSSAYGPDEAFRALGAHTALAVLLALATCITVFVISWAYSRVIEQFPTGSPRAATRSSRWGAWRPTPATSCPSRSRCSWCSSS